MDFEKRHLNCLQAGDKIRILSRVNEQWLFGETGGSKGSFPASFVDMVPSDLPHYEADETSVETDTASHSQSLLSAPTSAGGSRKKVCLCVLLLV